jgi:ABC-type branched-subunit amino acid transport system substrate-binding protein/TolA-binding protein
MLSRKNAAPALFGILALFTGACATTPTEAPAAKHTTAKAAPTAAVGGPITPSKGAPGVAKPASPREERDFREIFTLYSRGSYDAAIQKLQLFDKTYPQSSLSSQAENLHGLSYLLTKRPAQAVAHFRRAIDESASNPSMTQYLTYNLADAQFEAGQVDEARKTAAGIDVEPMDKENRIKVHYLRARIEAQRAQHLEAAREALAAGKLLLPNSGKETRNAVATLLEGSLKSVSEPAALEELYRRYEDSTLSDAVLFRLGTLEAETGQRDKAISRFQLLMSRFPESPYYAQAAELARTGGLSAAASPAPVASSGRDTGPVDGRAIGVLLPMKGKFAKFGARSLQGIEMAFGVFNASHPDNKITLHVEDSGDEADSAVRALDRLVKQRHVVAVIGPLLSKGIDQVTARAEELGVPLVSLARHLGIQSDYIFQAGLTLRLQAREIARFAVEKLGMKRFAIVYPRDKVGEDGMQKFWDAAESLGGVIRGVESYNPGETDFRQPVDRLAGLYYTEARAKELEDLAKERELNKIKKRTRKTEKYYVLKPIIDFDAVFIPEEPKVAGQLLPTFAYRDVDGVRFLGTSAWNSPDFPARVANMADHSYFLDAFFPESQAPATRKYVEAYRSMFNQEPTSMDALAYDAGRVVESIVARNDGLSRSDLRDKLKDVKNFNGVTGKLTYQEGQFSRDLKILTVKGGKIIEAAASAGE